MRRRVPLALTLVALFLGALAARPGAQRQRMETVMAPLFAPVEIGASIAALPDTERRALTHIIEAARVMDGIFLEQVWAGNPPLLLKLVADETPRGRARLDFFLTNKGPWSRLEDDRPFIPEVPPKPEGANYYPPGCDQRGNRGVAGRVGRSGPGGGNQLLHHDPATSGRLVDGLALQHRVRGRTGGRGSTPTRGRAAHDPAEPGTLSPESRGRFRVERVLRQRRGVDGARFLD